MHIFKFELAAHLTTANHAGGGGSSGGDDAGGVDGGGGGGGGSGQNQDYDDGWQYGTHLGEPLPWYELPTKGLSQIVVWLFRDVSPMPCVQFSAIIPRSQFCFYELCLKLTKRAKK